MYDYAQTFFIDKAKLRGSPQANISRVDLYFKSKPKVGAGSETNKSGIVNPGVEVSIVETNGDGTPNLTRVLETARLEYGQIAVSGDAKQETRFVFNKEVYIATDKLYAIFIRFDGMEDYTLWTNKKGHLYVNTNTTSPGVTDKLVGNLFKTTDRLTADFDPNASGGSGANQGVNSKATWVPMADEDLTFEVFVARYRNSGTSNTANTITSVEYKMPSAKYEYILFDVKHSKRESRAHDGEKVFQLNPLASNNGNIHTISVQKGNTVITSPTANFNSIYTSSDTSYIVLVSASQNPGHISGDSNIYNVCKVVEVEGNTVIVDRAPTFTNSVANFIVSPVGEVDFLDRSRAFNARHNSPSWYWSSRKRQDMLVLKNSNANLTHRFVNNSIHSISITAAGGGYSNTDYLVITSSSNNSVNAYANVRTNSSGNLTAVYLTNAGAGLIAQPQVTVRANATNLSTGSGATFSMVEGPWLKSEIKKFVMKDIDVIDFEVDAVTPNLVVNNPGGSSYKLKHQLAYIKNAIGEFIINQNAAVNQRLIRNFKKNGLPYRDTPATVSRSNEVLQLATVTGNNIAVIVEGTSNNDFVDTCPSDSVIYYHKHIINNDYTNEHTSYGNAAAKHITSKVTFAEGRLAEDSLVILRAFRPPGTNFKVYVRLYNSQDPEAFDDKDWTLMENVTGGDQVSSPNNNKDIREFTYGIPLSPNTTMISVGTAKLESGNVTVTGTGTTFTSELAGFKSGDLVKIYDPLFTSNYFISSVNSVTNATTLVLDDSTSNTSLLGDGKKIAKLGFKNQAFRNVNNDNVVRYYNTSMHVYDGYDTMAIKIVMLSSNSTVIPEIEDIRAIGASA